MFSVVFLFEFTCILSAGLLLAPPRLLKPTTTTTSTLHPRPPPPPPPLPPLLPSTQTASHSHPPPAIGRCLGRFPPCPAFSTSLWTPARPLSSRNEPADLGVTRLLTPGSTRWTSTCDPWRSHSAMILTLLFIHMRIHTLTVGTRSPVRRRPRNHDPLAARLPPRAWTPSLRRSSTPSPRLLLHVHRNHQASRPRERAQVWARCPDPPQSRRGGTDGWREEEEEEEEEEVCQGVTPSLHLDAHRQVRREVTPVRWVYINTVSQHTCSYCCCSCVILDHTTSQHDPLYSASDWLHPAC